MGSLQPRKNLPALLRAWETLCSAELPGFSELYLVIAGETGRAFRREGWPRLPERVLLLGYVPETDLPGLYAGAEVFVLPAWDEGFGLTILEAMACGTAVIASQRGALPEVSGGAALLFDPSLPSALLAALEQVLTEPGVRAGLVEKGLRRSANSGWEQPAQDLWRVIQACQ